MPKDNFTCKGVWHNRGFTTQRADYFRGDVQDDLHYAFHEWTFFPHFGEVMIGNKTRTSYWLQGWAKTTHLLMKNIAAIGLDPKKYGSEECPYGPGVFPICAEYDDAVAYYKATHKEEKS